MSKRPKSALADAPAAPATPPSPPAPPPPEPISLNMGIQRVRNGFLVEVSVGADTGFRERPKFVARDAYELGELVRRWATGPQPPKKKPARPAKPTA
jgi:hypothetical protein